MTQTTLLPNPLPEDPLPTFKAWFDEAHTPPLTDNPNAMIVASVDTAVSPPKPSARVVLCKGMDLDAGFVSFYTNYTSRKGRELLTNRHCSAVFHWDNVERQVRIEGVAIKAPAAQSDRYFATRHAGSRVGAWASDQSQPLGSRDELVARVRQEAERFDVPLNRELEAEAVDTPIPRPDHWGGFNIWIEAIELWCGGQHRVHDRARYTRDLTVTGETGTAGPWRATRLFP